MARGGRGRWLDSAAVSYLMIALGLLIMSLPSLFALVASHNQDRIVQSMTDVADGEPDDETRAALRQAEEYNSALAASARMDGVLPYGRQIDADGSGRMCWVEIPAADIRMVVYHGTSDDAMALGAGHLDWTSLPIGGRSAHCALTAHSGLGTFRGFDDIRELVPGDHVYIHVLGEVLAYEVTGSEVVLPNDTSSLRIRDGEDLLTLITCTPYGVNDHRLLVHCRRVPYDAGAPKDERSTVVIHTRDVPVLLAFLLIGGVIAVPALIGRVRRRRICADRRIPGAPAPSSPHEGETIDKVSGNGAHDG